MDCCENQLNDKVIITDTLDGIGTGKLENFLAHAICLSGEASFIFNNGEFKIQKGDLMIVRKGKLIENFVPSQDFQIKVVYLESAFVELATPNTNYGMKGALALFLNPVMHLSDFQFNLCCEDFRNVEFRHKATCYRFYEEGLRCAIQLMLLDFFDFHSRNYGESTISSQYAVIMNKFLAMLENGDYRQNREVTYYASELCVTAKYLSEICKKTSGHSANFWINRYTILDISRHLRKKEFTFVQLSDLFNFSSPAYFSRYVQRYLGMSPSKTLGSENNPKSAKKPTDYRD